MIDNFNDDPNITDIFLDQSDRTVLNEHLRSFFTERQRLSESERCRIRQSILRQSEVKKLYLEEKDGVDYFGGEMFMNLQINCNKLQISLKSSTSQVEYKVVDLINVLEVVLDLTNYDECGLNLKHIIPILECLCEILQEVQKLVIKVKLGKENNEMMHALVHSDFLKDKEIVKRVNIEGMCDSDSELDLIYFFKEILPQIKDIKQLFLSLKGQEVTDKVIKDFVEENFLMIHELEYLELRLGKTAISDNSVIPLLGCLKHLQTFIVNLSGTKVTDNSLEILIQAISRMETLKRFELDLRDVKVSNDSLEGLFAGLNFHKTLGVHFAQNPMKDRAKSLEEKLLKLKAVKDYTLNINETPKNKEDIKKLFENMKNLKAFILLNYPKGIINTKKHITKEIESVKTGKVTEFRLILKDKSIDNKKVALFLFRVKAYSKFELLLSIDSVLE